MFSVIFCVLCGFLLSIGVNLCQSVDENHRLRPNDLTTLRPNNLTTQRPNAFTIKPCQTP